MAAAAAPRAGNLLGQIASWSSEKRESYLDGPARRELDRYERLREPLEAEVNQHTIFTRDISYQVHLFSYHTLSNFSCLTECVALTVVSPFALLAEVYQYAKGSNTGREFISNIGLVSGSAVRALALVVVAVANTVLVVVDDTSTTVGLLAWHGGEWAVRMIQGSSTTVLSNKEVIRAVVYNSLGSTLLAAGALFIPVASIQLIALPIILGSIYGAINNQFTVRECPEYYTMGHSYDGTNLRNHAIKTNSLWIKPFITGCYATTTVTKISGLVLSLAGTLPYAATALSLPPAAIMIAGVCVVSLVAGQIFSMIEKSRLQTNLQEYANLIGLRWTEENLNRTWENLEEVTRPLIEQKQRELAPTPDRLQEFNTALSKVSGHIDGTIEWSYPNIPIRYVTGWHTNNMRNLTGYVFAGAGTVAITVATVFARIMV